MAKFHQLNSLFLLLSALFICSCDPFTRVERNTTQKSIRTFKQEKFMEAPFQKRKAFQQLSNFLSVHSDTLLSHAINTSKVAGRAHEVKDYGKGMREYDFKELKDQKYLQNHIPSILIDSLRYYLSQSGEVSRLIISTKLHDAYDESKACISLYLRKDAKGESGFNSYKIYHIVHSNAKPNKEVLAIKDPYNELIKTKEIAKGLHYEVRVVPNTF